MLAISIGPHDAHDLYTTNQAESAPDGGSHRKVAYTSGNATCIEREMENY
jgi:hypothetical protein